MIFFYILFFNNENKNNLNKLYNNHNNTYLFIYLISGNWNIDIQAPFDFLHSETFSLSPQKVWKIHLHSILHLKLPDQAICKYLQQNIDQWTSTAQDK